MISLYTDAKVTISVMVMKDNGALRCSTWKPGQGNNENNLQKERWIMKIPVSITVTNDLFKKISPKGHKSIHLYSQQSGGKSQ